MNFLQWLPRRLAVMLAGMLVSAPALAQELPGAPGPLPDTVLKALADAGLPQDSLGVQVRRVDARRPFMALNDEVPFVLASTTKVVTSLAALDLLGPGYRWRTFAYANGAIVDGRLQGDLLIAGGGDARLSSDGMQRWFERLNAEGLRGIDGNIVLDRFAFRLSAADHAHTPPPDPDRPHHVRPDALTLDEGVLRIEIGPAGKGLSRLSMSPQLADVDLVNAVSRRGGCTAHAAMDTPGSDETNATLRLVVRGGWSPACGVEQISVAPLSHGEFTTRAVAALWRRSGGELRGHALDRGAAESSGVAQRDGAGQLEMPVSVHLSDPLSEVLREINKSSNNLGARNLLLSLSPGFPMQAATLDAARTRVEAWLRRQGLATDDMRIDNGAGLSRTERGKPRAMVDLLCRAWRGRSARAFVDSLPIAGVDGTLRSRFQGGAAQGNAFLKTGSLLDVRALAGYVRARDGSVYAVAAMLNHPDAARGAAALDALIEWVAAHG